MVSNQGLVMCERMSRTKHSTQVAAFPGASALRAWARQPLQPRTQLARKALDTLVTG